MEQNYALALYVLGFLALFAFGIWFSVTRPAVQILEQTQSKLAFRIRPVFFWVVGVVFGGVGLLVLIVPLTLTPVTTLTCNRSVPTLSLTNTEPAPASVVCELVVTGWLGNIKNKIPLSQLQGAALETETENYGQKNSRFRVVLLTDEGQVPFPWHYHNSDYEEWQNLTVQINGFVEKPTEASLSVHQDERSLGYASIKLGSFLWLALFLVVAAVPTITCTLDQESNSLTLKRQKYFGAKSLTFKLSLDDISEVLVESSNYSEVITRRVTLKLTSGERFPITYAYDSLGGKEQLSTFIRRFLSLHRANQK